MTKARRTVKRSPQPTPAVCQCGHDKKHHAAAMGMLCRMCACAAYVPAKA